MNAVKGAGRRLLSGSMRYAAGIGFGITLLVLWQVLAMVIGKSYILPSPVAVVQHLIGHAEEILAVHLPATMLVVAIGGVLAVLIGFLLAVLMDANRMIERIVSPVLTVTQTIPVMCIAPVFVLWFGYSLTMRIIVVILVNFFTVAVNVFDGLQATAQGRTELMQTFGASKAQCFFLLRLPTAMPAFFTALRIVIPWSMIAAVVSEWLGAPAGLGCYSRKCMADLDAAGLLAPLVLLTAIALLLTGILQLVERRIKR